MSRGTRQGRGRAATPTRAQRRAARRRVAQRAAERAARAAEPAHVRRRRRLLRRIWLPAAVLLGLGVHLLVLLPVYAQGRAAWDAGDDRAAADVFERQQSVVPVERWKAHFNAGTAHARAGRWSTALDALDQALLRVPDAHRCAVQTNRAVVLATAVEATTEYAEESLAEAEAVRVAEVARAAGEPYDEEVLEPPYEGADVPTYADELRFAQYLFERAADQAALRAEALADPACATPPSSGGGGAGGGGGGGADERAEQQQAAQEQLEDLSGRAQEIGRTAGVAERGLPQDAPAVGDGAGEAQAPTPEQAEAERQAQVAERNQQANGPAGGAGEEPVGGGPGGPDDGSSGGTPAGGPGGGRDPGQGGGGQGGRRW